MKVSARVSTVEQAFHAYFLLFFSTILEICVQHTLFSHSTANFPAMGKGEPLPVIGIIIILGMQSTACAPRRVERREGDEFGECAIVHNFQGGCTNSMSFLPNLVGDLTSCSGTMMLIACCLGASFDAGMTEFCVCVVCCWWSRAQQNWLVWRIGTARCAATSQTLLARLSTLPWQCATLHTVSMAHVYEQKSRQPCCYGRKRFCVCRQAHGHILPAARRNGMPACLEGDSW